MKLNNFKLLLAVLLLSIGFAKFASAQIDNVSVTNITCYGDGNGKIVINATGNPELLYSIDGGQTFYTDSIFSGLSAGTYNVWYKTSISQPTEWGQIEITEPLQIVANVDSLKVPTCSYNSDGEIYVSAEGGTGILSYTLRNSYPGDSISSNENGVFIGLPSNDYRCIITDENGCNTELSYLYLYKDEIYSNISSTDETCLGENNGIIEIMDYEGGYPISERNIRYTPPVYEYSIDTGQTFQSSNLFLNLSPGLYSIITRDENECTDTTDWDIEIASGDSIFATIIEGGDTICMGTDFGFIEIRGRGGYNYNFLWNNGMVNSMLEGVVAGEYICTITETNSGCVGVDTFTIEEYNINITETTQAPTTCISSDGSISLSATGDTSGISYMWIDMMQPQSRQEVVGSVLSDISAGTYFCEITYGMENMCMLPYIGILSDSSINTPPTVAFVNVIDKVCYQENSGYLEVNVTGGSSYAYDWDGLGGQLPMTNNISEIGAGEHFVKVTDEVTHCVTVASHTILESNISITNIQLTNPTCHANNGEILIEVTGGFAPYEYSIDGQNYQTNNNFSGLNEGSFFIAVRDENNCMFYGDEFPFEDNSMKIQYLDIYNPTCHGENGSAYVYMDWEFGSETYSYEWSTGETSQNLYAPAGTYQLTITDLIEGCVIDTSVTIVEPEEELIITETLTDVSCFAGNNGEINLSVAVAQSSGSFWFSYYCSNGNSNNNVYHSGETNSPTNILINNLSAGEYTVTVTKNCSTIRTYIIEEPTQIIPSIEVLQGLCNPEAMNGSLAVSSTGGLPPYNYIWSNQEFGDTINNLLAEEYTVTVMDQSGCSNIEYIDLFAPQTPLAVNIMKYDITCNGNNNGAIALNAEGGANPYEYNWSHSTTVTTDSIGDLPEGTYSVTITDANNCDITTSSYISEPLLLHAGFYYSDINNVTCYGGNDGSLTATPSGGIYPYSFDWGYSTTEHSNTLSDISAGVYDVTVTDANGCEAITSQQITQPNEIITYVEAAICEGESMFLEGADRFASGVYYDTLSTTITGCDSIIITDLTVNSIPTFSLINDTVVCQNTQFILDANISGSEYLWSSGQTSQSILVELNNDSTFAVTVTKNGCSYDDNVFITVNQLTEVFFNDISGEYCKNSDRVMLSGNFGTQGLFFGYGVSNNVFNPANAHIGENVITYSYIDENECENSASQTVIVNTVPTAQVVSTEAATCGNSNGSVTIEGVNGLDPYEFVWSNNATETSLVDVAGGVYSVTTTDANNCSSSKLILIQNTDGPTVSIASQQNAGCYSSCDGIAMISVTGGVTPYTYVWSNGETTQNAYNLCSGENSVIVTGAAGCSASASLYVGFDNPDPTIYGSVTYSGGAISGQYASLEIFSTTHSIHGGYDEVPTQVSISNAGMFILSNFAPDQYIIKVKLTNDNPYHLANTYYSVGLPTTEWANATNVGLNCGANIELNIEMYEMQAMTPGEGRITGGIFKPLSPIRSGSTGGGIYVPTGNFKAQGEPVPGAEIFLELEPDEQPISNSETGGDGNYGFNHIGNGSYSLRVEIPGFPQISTYAIDVTDADTLFLDRIFFIDTTTNEGYIDTIPGDSSSYVTNFDNENFSLQLYPNPFVENINFKYSLTKQNMVSVDVYDVLGNKTETTINESQEQGEYNYNFNAKKHMLNKGTYIVKFTVGNVTYMKKIVFVE